MQKTIWSVQTGRSQNTALPHLRQHLDRPKVQIISRNQHIFYAMKLSPYAVPESGFSMAVGIDHRRNLIFLCDLCKRRTFF